MECVPERHRGLTRRQTLSLVLSLALVALSSGLVGLFLWDFHHPVRLVTLLWGEKVYRYYLVLLARFVLTAEGVGMGLWVGSAYLRVRTHSLDWVSAMHQRAPPFIPYLVLPLSMLRYWVHPLGVTYGSSIWTFLFVLVLSAGLAWLGGGIARDLQALITSVSRLQRWLRGRYLVLLVAAVYFCTFAFLSVSKHDSFRTHAHDLGTMDQAIWNTSQGRILEFTPLRSLPSGPSQPDNRLTGGKLELIFLPLAVLYWLWADPRLLLIVQTLFLAWGAIPLYEIARDRLKDGMAAFLISAAYLAYLPLHYVNMHDFHAPVLMVPFLFYVFLFSKRQQWRRYYLFLLLAFLCRVDAALIALALGFYLFAFHSSQRRHGLWTVLLSLVWLALDFGLVAPLVESRYGPGTNDLIPQRFGSFGEGALSVGWSILSHPGAVVATLADREKVQTLFELLAPLGFLPLAGPGILIPALPVVFLNLLAESPWQGTIYAHYFAPAIPFLAVAAVYGLDNLTQWMREGLRVFRLEALQSAAVPYHLALFALINALLVAYFFSPFPPGQFFHLANYRQVTAHERVLREIIGTLPAEAKMSAQSSLFPHLSHRPFIYLFPIVADAQYVLVDLDPAAEKSPLDWYSFMGRLGDLQTGSYVPTRFHDGVLLLERGGGEVVPIDFESELQTYSDGLFRVEFLAHSTPSVLRADQLYMVKLTVVNRGNQSWVSMTSYFPVRLSYHWRDSEGKAVVWDGVRTDFPYPVRPGRAFTAKAILITPEQPGDYVLEWDLVQEEINWFAERGSSPLRVSVVVEEDAPSKSGTSDAVDRLLSQQGEGP